MLFTRYTAVVVATLECRLPAITIVPVKSLGTNVIDLVVDVAACGVVPVTAMIRCRYCRLWRIPAP